MTLRPVRQSVAAASPYWSQVKEDRSAWAPPHVTAAISAWAEEARFGDALVAAGERVAPLLLVGQTRCGKTSGFCWAARSVERSVYRLGIASIVGSMMGETSRHLQAAFDEIEREAFAPAVYLIDEIDGIALRRRGDTGADAERTTTIASLLALLEQLPPGTMLAATSNVGGLLDPAVAARFRTVEYPRWDELSPEDRTSFGLSHGLSEDAAGYWAQRAGSYAEVVDRARHLRVSRIIEAARAKEARR